MKLSLPNLLILSLFFSCQSDNSNQSVAQETENTSEIEKNAEEVFTYEGCFQLEEEMHNNKTVTFIILAIEGTDVHGEEAIEMTGSEYNAVAAGSFEGTFENGIIRIVYEFDIEGDHQMEEQEFKLTDDGLMQTKSPLRNENGVMKIMEKGLFNKLIPKIDCP